MKNLDFKKYYLIIASLFFIIGSFSSEVYGQGSIVNTTFYSKSLNINRAIQIYLPQGYNQLDSTVRYPVIYFLHGATVNQTYYSELFSVFNNQIAAHFISPLIVVKPDGSKGPYASSYYTNSELYGNFEDYMVFDLVEFIDSAYNTIPSREKRAIMGHSTGAFGAMKLAIKHPDVYCGVSAHSGPLDFMHFSDWIPLVLSENGGTPVPVFNPSRGIMTLLFYSMAGAFSPNLNNSPEPVDFPIDSLGNWIDSIWNRWLLHDPASLAKNLTQSSDLAIFFDCGIYDEFNLYNFNTAFADSLDNYGLPHVYQTYNGNHTNQLVGRFSIALRFLDTVMNRTVGLAEEFTNHTPTFYLNQNYPNPFNPTTTIGYVLQEKSNAKLTLLNALGEEVAVLVNEEQDKGYHRVEFNGSKLTSGVYFYQLRAGSFVETKKMILLR